MPLFPVRPEHSREGFRAKLSKKTRSHVITWTLVGASRVAGTDVSFTLFSRVNFLKSQVDRKTWYTPVFGLDRSLLHIVVPQASTIVTKSTLYSQLNLSLHFFIICLRTRYWILLARTTNLMLSTARSASSGGAVTTRSDWWVVRIGWFVPEVLLLLDPIGG